MASPTNKRKGYDMKFKIAVILSKIPFTTILLLILPYFTYTG